MAEVVDNRKQRKIMVAVDESEESMYALSWALDFLNVGQAKDTLVLLYAQPLPRVYMATDGTDMTRHVDHFSKGLSRRHQKLKTNCCLQTDGIDLSVGYLFFLKSVGCSGRSFQMAETESNHKQRKIMVAVDESEESMNALCWALDFFCIGSTHEQAKDTLILLHAQPPPEDFTDMDSTGYIFSSEIDQAVEKYRKNVTENVLKRAKRICIGKNVCEETRMGVGDARDVICEEVDKVMPDFLVIGSHGYGTIKRAFLGSVSDYCAHNVKCPVLIVKHLKKS